MQRLQFALFQIDEAKRYLTTGPLPALRVALMLLDNAVEVLLDRWVAQDLDHDALSERIQERAREVGIPETHPQFSDLYQRRFLTGNEKRKVARLFDGKIRYVTEVKAQVSPSVGAVLSHLHRYRNEAHHSGRVRPQTLRTSVMILLELSCRLIESLTPMSAGYNSSEDFSWLEGRFNLKPHDLWNQKNLASILAAFREGILIGDASLRETLARNLEGRLGDLTEALDFISSETRVALDRAAALAESQKFTVAELKRSPPYRSVPQGLDVPVSVEEVVGLRLTPDRVRNAADSVTGFEIYAVADVALERIEFMVDQLAGAIDAEIQLEIDRARGE